MAGQNHFQKFVFGFFISGAQTQTFWAFSAPLAPILIGASPGDIANLSPDMFFFDINPLRDFADNQIQNDRILNFDQLFGNGSTN